MILRQLFVSLGLIAAAAALRFWAAPALNLLPSDYASETKFLAESRFRDAPNDEWQVIQLINRRVDQTLSSIGDVSIIQGNLHSTSNTGEIVFESSARYGVDRHTRQNLPGYGDLQRSGLYLMPTRLTRETFEIWDPMFIGPRTVSFDRVETLDGLEVYVFHFTGTGMNETAGYSALPDVPERYYANTDGQGTLWIEPVSGTVVDYEEQGVSYLVDPATGKIVADIHRWNARYTTDTRDSQLALARTARSRILWLEDRLPIALLLFAAISALISLGQWARRRSKVTP